MDFSKLNPHCALFILLQALFRTGSKKKLAKSKVIHIIICKQNQAGTAPAVQGIVIPPKTSALSLEYLCRGNVFQNIFGASGEITVFAHSPHTHLAGTQVFSKVIRNGKEVEYIANNKYYDFNYQYVNFMQKPVTMRRGDELLVNCVYKTDRPGITTGGLASMDEMW